MIKMKKNIIFHLLCCFAFFFTSGYRQCESLFTTSPQPRSLISTSLDLNSTHHLNQRSCAYRVSIRTSCYSPTLTRDQISVAFGDAHGNQVYAPRLDDPSVRTFEQCSRDEFRVYGPCTHQVCYIYLYRSGYDGWVPETVMIYGHHIRPVTFNFNTYIPGDTWFGYNLCTGYSMQSN